MTKIQKLKKDIKIFSNMKNDIDDLIHEYLTLYQGACLDSYEIENKIEKLKKN